jgi:prepilin-type N-terminal cleavage/methylation domain-containing protein
MRAAPARRAYTLLEIILVMALIVIMSAVAVPMMQSMLGDARVSAAGDLLRGQLAETRGNAMGEGRPWRLAFLPNTGVFQMAPEESSEWDNVVQDPILSPDVTRDALPKDIVMSLNQGDIMGNEKAIAAGSAWETIATYSPDGSARDDVTVYYGRPGFGPNRVVLRSLTGSVSMETFNLKADQQ